MYTYDRFRNCIKIYWYLEWVENKISCLLEVLPPFSIIRIVYYSTGLIFFKVSRSLSTSYSTHGSINFQMHHTWITLCPVLDKFLLFVHVHAHIYVGLFDLQRPPTPIVHNHTKVLIMLVGWDNLDKNAVHSSPCRNQAKITSIFTALSSARTDST